MDDAYSKCISSGNEYRGNDCFVFEDKSILKINEGDKILFLNIYQKNDLPESGARLLSDAFMMAYANLEYSKVSQVE